MARRAASQPASPFVMRFPRPDRPMSENEARRSNHWEISRRLDPWKAAVGVAWSQARGHREHIVDVPCFVQMELPFSRAGRRDPSNYVGTVVKASIDMLVHLHVWPDDTPEWVTVLEPLVLVGELAAVHLIPRELRASRAVRRRIDPGNEVLCTRCHLLGVPVSECRLKFTAKNKKWQVIANVYQAGQWLRVEHFHPACYEALGEPYGPADPD
jgi:Holliday junction resolvase RusA-like endonuclease